MAGIVNDSLMGAIGGIGQGISRGIEDYGRIQAIREQQANAPLQRGVLQSQLERNQIELNKIKQQEAIENSPLDYKMLPQYQAATPEVKQMFDTALSNKPQTHKGVLTAFQELHATSEGFKAMGETGISMMAPKVTEAQQNEIAENEKLKNIPTQIKDQTGKLIDNPEYKAQTDKAKAARENANNIESLYKSKQGDVNKGFVQRKASEMEMDFQDDIRGNPALKLMVDYVKESGNPEDIPKLLDILAKAKEPSIKTVDEAIIKSHWNPVTKKLDLPGILKDALAYKKAEKSIPSVHLTLGGGKESNEDKIVKEAKDRFIEEHREDIKSGKIKVPTRGTILKEYYGEKAGEISRDQAPYKPQKDSLKNYIMNEDKNVDIDVSGGIEIDPTKFQEK